MATSVKMVGAGDLGMGLKQVGSKVVARTIISQVSIQGQTYLMDSNGFLLPTETWSDFYFNLDYRGTSREITFSDLEYDTENGVWKLKAGTVVAIITQIGPSGLGGVIGNGATHPLNVSISDESEEFKLIFGNDPDAIPYIESGVDFGSGTDPFGYRAGSLVPSPYLSSNLAEGELLSADITFELDHAGLTINYGALPVPLAIKTERTLPGNINNYFADPTAPLQSELDAANAAGAFWGNFVAVPGPVSTSSYVQVKFKRVILTPPG